MIRYLVTFAFNCPTPPLSNKRLKQPLRKTFIVLRDTFLIIVTFELLILIFNQSDIVIIVWNFHPSEEQDFYVSPPSRWSRSNTLAWRQPASKNPTHFTMKVHKLRPTIVNQTEDNQSPWMAFSSNFFTAQKGEQKFSAVVDHQKNGLIPLAEYFTSLSLVRFLFYLYKYLLTQPASTAWSLILSIFPYRRSTINAKI